MADLDGDGDLDLVIGFSNSPPSALAGGAGSFIYGNDGHGKLTPFRFTVAGQPASTAQVTAAFPGMGNAPMPLVFDANGDGVNDIVLVAPKFPASLPASPTDFQLWSALAGPP